MYHEYYAFPTCYGKSETKIIDLRRPRTIFSNDVMKKLICLICQIQPLIFDLNQKGSMCMYIVHIKVTLYIQALVY